MCGVWVFSTILQSDDLRKKRTKRGGKNYCLSQWPSELWNEFLRAQTIHIVRANTCVCLCVSEWVCWRFLCNFLFCVRYCLLPLPAADCRATVATNSVLDRRRLTSNKNGLFISRRDCVILWQETYGAVPSCCSQYDLEHTVLRYTQVSWCMSHTHTITRRHSVSSRMCIRTHFVHI